MNDKPTIVKPDTTITTTIKMSSDLIDSLSFWSQVGVVICGAVALLASKEANKRQAREIAELQSDLSKTDLARLELTKLIQEPRRIDFDKSVKVLQSGSKGIVTILYLAENLDAASFADQIYGMLEIGGWNVSEPRTADKGQALNKGMLMKVPLEGMTDIPAEPMAGLPEPANTLYRALAASQPQVGWIGLQASRNQRAEEPITLVIGPKY